MLQYLGHSECAEKVHNAWLCAIEDGMHTGDIYQEGHSKQKLGTQAFAEAVIARLGKSPQTLKPAQASVGRIDTPTPVAPKPVTKEIVGVDIFLHWDQSERDPDVLANYLTTFVTPHFKLTMMSNRGTKVWPKGAPETFCTDHWRCRFMPTEQNMPMTQAKLLDLLQLLHEGKVNIIKTENLYTFDGKPGYSLGQGE